MNRRKNRQSRAALFSFSAVLRPAVLSVFVCILLSVLLAGCKTQRQPDSETVSAQPVIFSFITIGKGDAFLLQIPEDGAYLIDTGKEEDIIQILRLLRERQTDSLKGIFLSHGHKDHAGGLNAILTAIPTEAVYLSSTDTVSWKEIDPIQIAKNHQTPVVKLSSGDRLELGTVQVEVWCPPRVDLKEANNNSVILRLSYGDTSILMMGDAEQGEEAALLASGFPLKADILKLGHHGEDHSTSLELLNRVSPSYGIICGNEEENPDSLDPQVKARLKARNVEPFFSEGPLPAVDFILDGAHVTVKPAEDGEPLKALSHISLQQVDREKQCVTLNNKGTQTTDISGWLLYSERHSETYFFPQGTVLAPGASITVACRDNREAETTGETVLIWDEDSVWSKKHSDAAFLYDRNINLIDRKD